MKKALDLEWQRGVIEPLPRLADILIVTLGGRTGFGACMVSRKRGKMPKLLFVEKELQQNLMMTNFLIH